MEYEDANDGIGTGNEYMHGAGHEDGHRKDEIAHGTLGIRLGIGAKEHRDEVWRWA